ncbi:MAG: carboxypeptidase-like regulatory domain-containing protein [Candidatus Binatia bacterium]|nr:carboxypeptidase-like regulatory domain-containing protein [Candidatus Binatia bacterium]
MKPFVSALALVSIFGLATMATAEDSASAEPQTVTQSRVQGSVFDPDRNPVSGVDVILLSEAGAELGRTSTDATGAYSLGCVDLGSYQYEIAPTGNGYKGHKVVAPLGPNGLTIAWAVDHSKPALASATATGGPCGAAAVAAAGTGAAAAGAAGATGAAAGAGMSTGAIVVGGTAIAAGVGVGIAAAAGAFDSNSSAPSSPAQ